jgi:tetratricopeptide (TPR) repeat protein
MPKKRRAAASRPPARKPKPKSRGKATALSAERVATVKEAPKKEAPAATAPPAPPRRPAFYEALALYESGVRALQRHDFVAAAGGFREVIQRYPDERELVERARLYLQVCERETARRPSGPQTPTEWVYAATVALNAGDSDGALEHLNRALSQDPDSDHAHYIMSVALLERGDVHKSLDHLRQAISLNPDIRSNAIQDPDLASLRDLDAFREVLGTPEAPARRKLKIRR